MKRIRVSHLAERDLDEIWYYVAKNSHSMEIANGVVESIASHFCCWRIPRKPEPGATKSLPKFAGFRLAITLFITARAVRGWSSPASSTECAIRRSHTSQTIDSSQTGPVTMMAVLARILIALCFPVLLCAQTASPPTAAEQDRLLAAMRQYAARYVSNLPNFLCVQVTRQLDAGKKSDRWHKGDTLVSKLSYNQGHEERTLTLVNGKPIVPGRKPWRTPLVTEGEFGILLSRVLGPESEASFTWSGWETLRGKRLAVFDYSVDKQHSTLTLRLSDLAKAIVPYTGSVYADPATGAVWRITDTASEIPPELQTREISTTIDYDEIPIGGVTYLLPLDATVSLLLDKRKVRNEMDFQEYRKFEADSVITYQK